MKKIIFILVIFFCTSLSAEVITPLSRSDASLYEDIFKALDKENFTKSDRLAEELTDDSLMGYVLAKKYLSRTYKTKPAEITAWLKKYSDLPVAAQIYKLGERKKATLPKTKPAGTVVGKTACTHVLKEEPIDSFKNLTFTNLFTKSRNEAQARKRRIVYFLEKGKTLTAKNLLLDKRTISLFSQRQLDTGRTALAFSYFLDGHDNQALDMAKDALKKSDKYLPLASWTAGLVSWRQGQIENALTYFQQTAEHAQANDLLKAAASFWTARAHLKLGHYDQVGSYLEYAAGFPWTFYGLMALRALGDDLADIWRVPEQEIEEDIDVNFSHPALTRFYALKQIDQDDLAKKELSYLYQNASKETQGILRMISEDNGFAKEMSAISGQLSGEAARYPAPNWHPQGGWQIDKALVYAFVRQESCFNPKAVSKMGARGLMQLMPKTAKEMARNLKVPYSLAKLTQSEYNLSLGQNYLDQLLKNPLIDGNLILTAVAYNAGPGNLEKWKKRMNYNKDPLLFIESIPSKETRGFVERIMVNFWIYKSLFGESLSSLDDVISGKWPVYKK